jgi:nucleoside phosphorylase
VPRAIVGNIVAGEKLLGDATNQEQQALLNDFDHALAVDMESMGFARAVFKARSSVHYNPQCAVIRGISDLVDAQEHDNDATRQLWRRYASEAAVAFGRGVIEELLKAN